MKTLKPLKRSTSPFGLRPPDEDPLQLCKEAFAEVFKGDLTEIPSKLTNWADAVAIPQILSDLREAPSNVAKNLENFCQFLVRYKNELIESKLDAIVYEEMENLFKLKTSVFLVDHHDKESCEKQEWPDEYRDVVLFAKERDTLIGRFFSPYTEKNPGAFVEFISAWTQSKDGDQLLHFLDFCRGSNNPTFEHYLLFTHRPLSQLVEDKNNFKSLLEKVDPILKKLKSPTWESDLRKSLKLG